jgi:hypothetical protein
MGALYSSRTKNRELVLNNHESMLKVISHEFDKPVTAVTTYKLRDLMMKLSWLSTVVVQSDRQNTVISSLETCFCHVRP